MMGISDEVPFSKQKKGVKKKLYASFVQKGPSP